MSIVEESTRFWSSSNPNTHPHTLNRGKKKTRTSPTNQTPLGQRLGSRPKHHVAYYWKLDKIGLHLGECKAKIAQPRHGKVEEKMHRVTPSPNGGHIGFYCGGDIYIFTKRSAHLECAQFKNQSLKKKRADKHLEACLAQKSWSTYGTYVEDISDRQRNLDMLSLHRKVLFLE